MRVLPARSFERQKVFAKYLSVLCCGRGPIFPDQAPGTSKPFFVGIPVLRNYGRDALRVGHRQTKTCWRAIIEHIDCVAVDLERLRKGLYRQCQSIERINISPFGRNLSKSKTREVGRDDAVIIGEAWNEITEHERRGWESVE